MEVVIFDEKHAPKMFAVDTPDRRKSVFDSVLRDRIADGDYYEGEDAEKARIALASGKSEQFLTKRSRDGFEYEQFRYDTVKVF